MHGFNEDDDYAEGHHGDVRRPRRHLTYHSEVIHELDRRAWYRNIHDRRFPQATHEYMRHMVAPHAFPQNPAECIASRFLHHGFNKRQKSAVNVGLWTPNGERLICGTHNGEFTIWAGETFKFERIVSTHDTAIRSMAWSRNSNMFISGDQEGTIKYFESTLANISVIPDAHTNAVRGLSFSPSDSKFVSGSDDGTVGIWDWEGRRKEAVMTEHGWDVRCVAWHPFYSLVVSGSKDNTVKLWDPREARCLSTLYGHKNTVLAVAWNPMNGNWLATGARDHLIKLYDVRAMKEWLTLRGHDKEVCSLAWHPHQEALLASGGFNGALAYWMCGHLEGGGSLTPHTYIDNAHGYSVNTLAWHGVGYVLASASNDGIVKFWGREVPGSNLVQERSDYVDPLVVRRGPRLPEPEEEAAAAGGGRGVLSHVEFATNTHLDTVGAPDGGDGGQMVLRNPLPSPSSIAQGPVLRRKRKILAGAPP